MSTPDSAPFMAASRRPLTRSSESICASNLTISVSRRASRSASLGTSCRHSTERTASAPRPSPAVTDWIARLLASSTFPHVTGYLSLISSITSRPSRLSRGPRSTHWISSSSARRSDSGTRDGVTQTGPCLIVGSRLSR